MGKILSSFRDLAVYQMAVELQQELFELSKRFPTHERFALTDQMRRSSRAIGANLAEAWQKRRYPAHFLSKLTDADGEQAETQHWIDTSLACKYLTLVEHEQALAKCSRIGQMLGSMMAKSETFCRQ